MDKTYFLEKKNKKKSILKCRLLIFFLNPTCKRQRLSARSAASIYIRNDGTREWIVRADPAVYPLYSKGMGLKYIFIETDKN